MKRILMLLAVVGMFAGCASAPPMPPEPQGPLVKVNIDQPRETFGGSGQ